MVQYILIDKKEDQSSFYLNEDGTRDTERKLDFTNSRGILNPFFLIDENGVRQYKQYIVGSSTYDPAEHEKQKIKPTVANSTVQFVKGAPIVLDEKKGKVLIDWLDMHPFNINSTNHDPDLHDAMFKKYDPKEEVKKNIDRVNAEDEATDILKSLRKNPAKMMSVANLFESTRLMHEEDEVYIGLRQIAKEFPIEFKNSIANKENEVLSDVLKGLKYAVITKDAKGFIFADEEVLFETTTKAHKEANSELVVYLMSETGDVFYRKLLVRINQKEIELDSEKS